MRREKGAGENEGAGDPPLQHGENNREEFLNELQSYYPPAAGEKGRNRDRKRLPK